MKHFTTKNKLARAAMTLLVALLGSVTGAWAESVAFPQNIQNQSKAMGSLPTGRFSVYVSPSVFIRSEAAKFHLRRI